MRNQQPGMSPHPRQHPSSKEMQLWQQHLISKQRQELQRQQQLHQLDQGARQQNSLSQAAAKQAVSNQLPALLSGMPIKDACSYMLPNDIMGGESKTPSSSQMFIDGNMNWAQGRGSPVMHGSNGLMFSNDQDQTMRSMGFVPQQLDQSLYGTPVFSSRGLLNQYSQFQGMSNNFTDVMAKAGGNQSEKTSVQSAPSNSFQNDQCVPRQACLEDGLSVAAQGFQGKSLFANASVRSLSSDVTSGNFHHVNHPQDSVQVQELQCRQEQAGWSGNLEEKTATQVGPSSGVTSLDPTEEKILFGTDDDGNWDASFGRSINMSTGGYMHVNPLESDGQFGAFPSIQSGSWSALMQEAVQASSSDKGFQEEWSGLSFQRTEPSIGNQLAVSDDIGKHQATWDNNNNNLQTVSSLSLRPFPLFNDADSDSTCPAAPRFQHSIKTAYKQTDRVQTDASHESFQQSSKDAQHKHFDQSHKQKQFFEDGLQAQMQLNDVSNGVWSGHMYEQSVKTARSAGMEFNLQNHQDIWTRQQNVPFSNIIIQPDSNQTGWNLAPGGGSTSEVHDIDDKTRYAQDDLKSAIHLERDYDGSISKAGGNHVNLTSGMEPVKSDIGSSQIRSEAASMANFAAVINSNTLNANQGMNQHVLNRHQVDLGKHVAFDSFVKSRGGENVGRYQHQPSRGQQARDSSMNSSDPSPSISDSQMSSGLSGWKTVGSHRLQYHPMGNLGMNVEPAHSPNDKSCSQGLPQSVIRESKGQEQGYMRHPQFAGHVSNMGKGHSTDLQRSINRAEETQYRGSMPRQDSLVSASFDGSTAEFYQNRKIDQTSQNMLELLHKVDQSRDNSTVACVGNSDRNTQHDMHEAAASDGSALHPQHHQSSAFEGFSLRLAPPPPRQPISDHALHSQTSLLDFNTRQLDPEPGEKDQMQSASTASDQSLHPAHETSQRETWGNRSNLYGHTCKDASQSIAQGNSSAVTASDICYVGNQLQLQQHQQLLQQQHISSITGHEVIPQSVNLSFGRQADVDEHVKHASSLRRAQDSYDEAVADQSAQTSLPTMAGRILPFRLASSTDTQVRSSQFNSPDTGQSQPTNAGGYHLKNSGQQHPMVETGSVLQASATSGISQQAGFSTMLHNVWTNASVQQRLSGVQPHKLIPNIPPSIILSTSHGHTNSMAVQKEDDQGNKEGSIPSELGTCSGNSQQFTCGEETPVKDNSLQRISPERGDVTPKTGSASEEQEQVPKHHSDGNSAVSISSLVHLHQQDVSKGKDGQESFLKSHTECVPLPIGASSNSDVGIHGRIMITSDVQQPNYSLLQQMQAMKGADSDTSKRDGKRLKGNFGSDASQMGWKTGQRYIYGQNAVFRVPVDGELGATSHSSFPSDVQMLSFSMRKNEEKIAGTTSQLTGREVSSQDIYASGQHDLQNRTQPLSISCTSNFMGRNEHPQISPQMARSWFEHYRKYKDGQILAMHDDQRSAKGVRQQYFPAEVSERRDKNTLAEQRIETSQFGTLGQSTSLSPRATNESSPRLPLDITDHDMVLRPKKRKRIALELLPWYREVTLGSRRLQSISMAERDWAQAANRIIEKVEDEAEMIEDGRSVFQARRRLILTTQLMQQLLPSVPAAILAAEVTSAYESVAYFLAKSALGDACSLISCSESDSRAHLDCGNTIFEKLKTSEKAGDLSLSKVVEDFIGRSRKMESDLSRLDKRTSILDVRLECQELERFSLINRLGKFHGRSNADAVESSSTSQSASRRTFPQRYVTALAMHGNFPEGVLCLSL